MPLPRNYYTIEEARGLLARRFPDEPSYLALPELLHGWEVPTWIINRETGRRVDVPPGTFFKADDEVFRWLGGNEAAINTRRLDEDRVDLDSLLTSRPGGRKDGGSSWHFGEMRIDKETFKHALRQDDEDAEAKAAIGRPTFMTEIEAAYKELRDAKEIDFDAPKNKLFEPIREKVRAYKNDLSLQRGLGDEAIRKAIHPLFEKDKSAHSTSP